MKMFWEKSVGECFCAYKLKENFDSLALSVKQECLEKAKCFVFGSLFNQMLKVREVLP